METIKTYKLLRREADGLHPLFIDSAQVLPIGEWIEARAPDTHNAILTSDGYHCVNMITNKKAMWLSRMPTRLEVIAATMTGKRWIQVTFDKRGRRRYYDLGLATNGQVLRFAHRPGWHSSAEPVLPGVNMEGKVWAECLIPADDYTIRHMNINGMTAKSQPIDWYISKRIMITRILE